MVQQFHDNGRAIRMHVNLAGEIDSLEDSPGRRTDYGYDSQGRLFEVIAPDGATTTYSYDSAGRLATITVPMTTTSSTTVEFGYDASHRVTSVTQETTSPTWGAGADAVTGFAYGTATTEVTDPEGGVTELQFDGAGIAETVIDQLGNERSSSYSPNYDVASSTDALGAGGAPGYTTNYTFDGNANTTSAEVPTGAAAAAVYTTGPSCASTGGTTYQVKCSTDAAGNTTSYDYDANGNVTEQENTTAGAVEFEYTYENSSGTICDGFEGQICTATDGNGNTTSYDYDGDGDLITVTPPAPMGSTTYTHDALGRVLTVTDGNGDVSEHTWDVRDRLIETEYDGGSTVTTGYYPSGLQQSITDSAGSVKTFTYDAQGRITKQTGPTGADQRFAYDLTGNQVQYINAYGTTGYAYNAGNQLTSITQPGGTCPSSGAPASGAGCILFQYDANGAETKRILPGGAVIERTIDNSGRLTRVTGKTGANAVAVDVAYSYTGATSDQIEVQQRTSHREQGIPAGAVTNYTYDDYGRLDTATEAASGAARASWAYDYDAAGNRTQQVLTGATGKPAATTGYTYNAANQITATTADTSTWAYDGAGNQLSNGITGTTTSYGDRLQATSINGQAQNYFTGGNTERLSGGASTYLASPMGVHQVSTSSATQRYVRTATGEAVGWNNGATTDAYYVTDHLGSVLGLFAENGTWLGGYSYSPYGEDRTASTNATITANQLRYIGEIRDSTALYKFGARYYDSGAGRFTQWDSSGQELNPYAYGSCDPVNRADPSGLDDAALGCAASVIGLGIAYAGLGAAVIGTGGLALPIAGVGVSALGLAFSC